MEDGGNFSKHTGQQDPKQAKIVSDGSRAPTNLANSADVPAVSISMCILQLEVPPVACLQGRGHTMECLSQSAGGGFWLIY